MGGSLSGLAVAAAVLALAGCTYDWSVPPDAAPVDAGTGEHVSPPVDASSEDGPAPPVDAPTPPVDGPTLDTSVPETTPQSCTTLREEIAADLPAALACNPMMMNQCTTKLTDECDCPVVVQAGTAASEWAAAVASFKNEGCSTSGLCGACNTPTEGDCLVVDATAEKYACLQ
jgi:hypothetical protein